MKKVLLQICVVILLFALTACGKDTLSSGSVQIAHSDVVQSEDAAASESADNLVVDITDVSNGDDPNPIPSSDFTSADTSTDTLESDVETDSEITESTSDPEHQVSGTNPSTDNTNEINADSETGGNNTTNETPPEEPQPASPYDVIAREGTEELLAERIIYYINKYREEEGNVTATVLPGLTELCEYRSRQLINNFAHDSRDIREAATSLQYGRYTDPALWGIDDEQPYYDPMTQEAIGKYSVFSPYTVDAVAQKIASAFRKSDGHWAYLGASSQINKDCEYIGAGATFYNGTWFVCVSVNYTDKYG